MSKDLVIRLVCPAGRSRIVVPADSSFRDFQVEVRARTGVEILAQRFAWDAAGKNPVQAAAEFPMKSFPVAGGKLVYLVNPEASVAAEALTKPIVSADPEPVVGRGKTGVSLLPAGGPSAPTPYSSAAASSGASGGPAGVPAAASAAGEQPQAAFQAFDAFLRTRKYDCAGLPGSQLYTPGHKKQGQQIKIPPAVTVKQQPFRHVDTLSTINVPEVENFLGYWRGHLLEEGLQRLGWLYGYYLDDPNYDEGCRALVEGIYEPPQQMRGEIAAFLDDPRKENVDKVAQAMGLECVGWIFTTLPLHDGEILTPAEVLRIAELQLTHSTTAHFTGYRLSKFVSCAVRPDCSRGGALALTPVMVSDQCCTMMRDKFFCEATDRQHLLVRDPGPDELLPDFMIESKPSKKLLCDFFIVRVNDTAPKRHARLLTHAEFPRENRQTHPQRRDDLKKYFRALPADEPSWSRFADFHLMLYIAQEIDVDTAVAIGECIRDRVSIPEGVALILDELVK